MSTASDIVKYKVWIHIEGVDGENETVLGDEMYEQFDLFDVPTMEEAKQLQKQFLILTRVIQNFNNANKQRDTTLNELKQHPILNELFPLKETSV